MRNGAYSELINFYIKSIAANVKLKNPEIYDAPIDKLLRFNLIF